MKHGSPTPPDRSRYAHHVIQRGNNRQTIFHDARDYESLLALMKEEATRNQVAIHSYVVMDNHFHLLATPRPRAACRQ